MAFSVGGIVSGLDTDTIISKLMEIENQPVVQLQRQEAGYQVKLTAYGSLKSAVSSLQSAVAALKTADSLTQFSAASGDSDLFTASADSTAMEGSTDITVNQLAQAHKLKSAAFSDTEMVGAGTIHLKVGTAAATDIAISPSATIQDVAKAINDAHAGVTAAAIFDGSNYVLTLAAQNTGQVNAINLTVTDTGDGNNTDTLGLSRLVYDQGVNENLINVQSAQDAIIDVKMDNGVEITGVHRASNTISDVIQGVTFTLKSKPDAPDNTSTLTVNRDISAMASKITAFASAYNSLADLFTSQQSWDAKTKTGGTLLGDSTTSMMRNSITRLMQNAVPGVAAGLAHLSDLGVTLESNGHLKVESSKLNETLTSNFSDALQFLTQSTEGSEGFAVRLSDALDQMLDSQTGTLAGRTKGIQTTIDSLQDQETRLSDRLTATEARMRAQFNALESLLAQFKVIGDSLTQQLAGLEKLNQQISNQ